MDLTQFGASGAVVIVVVVFLKFLTDESKRRSDDQTTLTEAVKQNTRVTEETLSFMKNLNGKLERAVISKATVGNATIQNATIHHVEEP